MGGIYIKKLNLWKYVPRVFIKKNNIWSRCVIWIKKNNTWKKITPIPYYESSINNEYIKFKSNFVINDNIDIKLKYMLGTDIKINESIILRDNNWSIFFGMGSNYLGTIQIQVTGPNSEFWRLETTNSYANKSEKYYISFKYIRETNKFLILYITDNLEQIVAEGICNYDLKQLFKNIDLEIQPRAISNRLYYLKVNNYEYDLCNDIAKTNITETNNLGPVGNIITPAGVGTAVKYE